MSNTSHVDKIMEILAKEDDLSNDEILDLLASTFGSEPTFKYNKTYISDSKDTFSSILKNYGIIIDLFQNIINELDSKISSLDLRLTSFGYKLNFNEALVYSKFDDEIIPYNSEDNLISILKQNLKYSEFYLKINFWYKHVPTEEFSDILEENNGAISLEHSFKIRNNEEWKSDIAYLVNLINLHTCKPVSSTTV